MADFPVEPAATPSSAAVFDALPFSDEERSARIEFKLLAIRGHSRDSSAGLTSDELNWLCDKVQPIFMGQPILLSLKPPIVICGDTHGQYSDLLRIFDAGGPFPLTHYLFLGDYIDRGPQSIETVSLLFLYKIRNPDCVFLLRGNHECSYINRLYGFYEEVLRYHSMKIWRRFSEVFNWMPIAAVVDDKIFCVHGGLSPHLNSLEDIAKLDRPLEIPEEGLVCDLVWSDPEPQLTEDYGEGDRGTSVTFGFEVVNRFCDKYGFDLICRAHQAVMEGFDFPFTPEQRLVTIFSAPNYCNEFKNKGAILKVDDQLYCTFVLLEPILDEVVDGTGRGTPLRGWSQEIEQVE